MVKVIFRYRRLSTTSPLPLGSGLPRKEDRWVRDTQSRNDSLLLASEQWLFRVLGWHRHDVICQLGFTPAAAYEPNIAKVIAAIGLERVDFQFIVRGYHPVPIQPPLPAVGHGVRHINLHDACSFPVMSPPSRRMKAPEILGPPLAEVFG